MSRAASAVAASQVDDEPWLVVDAAKKPLSKADALAHPDAVLQEAIALVTATHTASMRKRRGDAGAVDIGDLHVATYDRHQCALLLQDLSQASGLLTNVDANGDVREDYDKMNAFASDVLEHCFASVPTEEEAGALEATDSMAAFQAVYKARAAREHIQNQCRAYVERKTEEEVRLTRRLVRTARELHKPATQKPKGGLAQPAFLASRGSGVEGTPRADGVEGGMYDSAAEEQIGRDADALVLDAPAADASLAGAVAAKSFARSLVARARAGDAAAAPGAATSALGAARAAPRRAGRSTDVDPYDDSVFGVTNRAIHLVRENTRVAQTALEVLLGYSSAVDPEDLDDIEAGARGLRAAEGKSLRELALKYAAYLDATLPERHKRVVTRLIHDAAEEHHAHAALGAVAEERYERRARESAGETRLRNRDAWTRTMFPDAPWPKQEDAASDEAGRVLRDGAKGPPVGALVNPTDPRSGVVGALGGGGDFPGSVADEGAARAPRSSFRRTEVRPEPARDAALSLDESSDPGERSGVMSRHGASTGWGEGAASEQPTWLFE